MTTILKTISALEIVARVNEWNGRHYVNLEAARGSRAKADATTKIWFKGETLTIETGKGYHSDDFIAAKHALIAAVEAAGGSVRSI